MATGMATANATAEMPPVNADIVTYMGPTFDPTGEALYEFAEPYFGSLNEGREIQFIPYPAGLWPMTGLNSTTLDASVAVGTVNAIDVINNRDKPAMLLIGGSQSAVVFSEVKKYYGQHPDQAPPAEDLTFIMVANPSRPNGGILARFPGAYIPGVDITFSGPTPNDQYATYDLNWAYDGFSNFPRYPLNALATLNALMGTVYQHGVPPNPFDPNNDVSVSVVGNTTYYTLMPEHLPLLRPLIDAGLGPLVSVIEPVLKVWVDAGYENNDPRANPGVPESAQLATPLQNIMVALEKTPAAIAEGISTIPESVRQALSGNPITKAGQTADADQKVASSHSSTGSFKPRGSVKKTIDRAPSNDTAPQHTSSGKGHSGRH